MSKDLHHTALFLIDVQKGFNDPNPLRLWPISPWSPSLQSLGFRKKTSRMATNRKQMVGESGLRAN